MTDTHRRHYEFSLDPFQREAIAAIDDGAHVVVAAPTGSGKTVIAEHAIDRALRSGARAFYTAPIKALSNQKYRDLVAFHGPERVGLLTGDHVVNGDAPVVVMTTEVLRNMIYAASPALAELGLVVLDEVHFLQDTYRGPVWEEVIIHTPATVQLVCLSATIGNVAQLTEWIGAVRGPAVAVVETERPVELTSFYLARDRARGRLVLEPIFRDGQANPAAAKLDADAGAGGWSGGRRSRPSRPRAIDRKVSVPGRVETVELLAARDMLPTVYFIFSRRQCAEAANAAFLAGLRFTDDTARRRIAAIVDARLGSLDGEDLDVLDVDTFVAQLDAGIAAHHAGMVPPFKDVVERCFAEGLVKVVFATETLAVGINMPARTVVIEKLTKFTGDHHESLTAGEYTQLTGRAGRRGIDARGHAVVPWSPFVRFEQVATLAASRSFQLRSAFRPTYNMAANLIRNYEPDEARHLLTMSFAQFQADREIVTLEARLERLRRRHNELRDAAESSYGDIWVYRESTSRAERRREHDDIDVSLEALRPGSVIWVNRGKYAGPGVVISRSRRATGWRVSTITAQATLVTLDAEHFTSAPDVLGRVDLPRATQPDRPAYRKDVARRLRRVDVDPPQRSRRSGRSARRSTDDGIDPVETDPDPRQRLRAAGDADRVGRDIVAAERRLAARNSSLAREFDSVLDLLTELGYVELQSAGERWRLTEWGSVLARVFHESELLVVECLRAGVLTGLDAPSLGALLSVFVYEHRSPDPPPPPWFPSKGFERRWQTIVGISDRLAASEQRRTLMVHRPPDPTFVALAYGWIAGESFADVVETEDLSGGDFVRTMKQVIDLARQVATVIGDADVAKVARRAAEVARRGVVADSAVSESPA